MSIVGDAYGSVVSQYPTFAGGHNVSRPDFPYATDLPGTAGLQVGFPLDQSSTLNQNYPQPSQYCPLPWNAMAGSMPNALPITDIEATGNNSSHCAKMDFSDDMLADFPIAADSASVNDDDDVAVQTFLPPAPAAAIPADTPPLPDTRIPCTFCPHTFARASDCTRHENSKHLTVPGAHLCPVPRCAKSHGKGFSRADKLTEHLWKKHAGLGYVKRV